MAGLAIVALTLSACSSSKKESSAGGTTGASGGGNKSTLKVGIALPIHAVVDYAEAVAAAQGAVRAVNAKGGVDGHPLELMTCNTALNPTKEQACARDMIKAKVVATAGSANYTAEKAVADLFRAAGIPQIGDYPSGIGETDPNSYLLFGGQIYANAGQIYAADKYVGKKVAVVRLDFPYTAPYPDQYKKQCAQLGCTVVSVATVPSNAVTDLSPVASQLLQGNPDVIVPDLGPLIVPLMKSVNQLGFKGKIVAQDTNITYKNFFAQDEATQEQYVVSTPFPPPFAADKFPGMKEFNDEMAAEKAAGDADAPTYQNYSSSSTMSAWLAVHALADVASQAKADDAASIKKAFDAAHDIDLAGFAKWDPSKVNCEKLPRASLDLWWYYTIKNGKATLLDDKSVAVTDLVKAAGVC